MSAAGAPQRGCIEPPTLVAIRQAAALLRAGDLVGMPTETVYGLAADALNPIMALGQPAWSALRHAVFALLTDGAAADVQARVQACLHSQFDKCLHASALLAVGRRGAGRPLLTEADDAPDDGTRGDSDDRPCAARSGQHPHQAATRRDAGKELRLAEAIGQLFLQHGPRRAVVLLRQG